MLNGAETYIDPEVKLFCIEGRNYFHVGWFLVNEIACIGDLRHCLSDVVKSKCRLRPSTSTDLDSEQSQLFLALTHPFV